MGGLRGGDDEPGEEGLYEMCTRECEEQHRVDDDICASLPTPRERNLCFAQSNEKFGRCLKGCGDFR